MLRFVFFPYARRCGSFLLLGFVLALSCMHNRPDAPAVPAGSDSVEVDSAYTFRTSASNGKEYGLVYVRFDWGDGDTSSWLGHDETTECSHSWREGGVFAVRAQAHDDRKELSEWSAPCSVTAVVPPYPYRLIDSVPVTDEDLLVDAQVLPNGEFIYVADMWDGILSVVRTSDLRLVTQISLNEGWWGGEVQVVCSPNGEYAYVAPYSYDYVGFIRTADQVVVDSTMLSEATSSAISPDGQRLYVAVDADSGFIVVVRLPDNVIEDTIFTPGIDNYTSSMRVTPDGALLFGGSLEEGSVYAIRLSDNRVEWCAPISGTSTAPGAIALHPTGSPLYVVEDNLSILESGTGSLINSVPVSPFLWSAEVTPDGSFVYVTCGDGDGSGAVAVVRTSDNKVVRVISMPSEVYDVAASPDGQRLYVAGGNGKLYVLSR